MSDSELPRSWRVPHLVCVECGEDDTLDDDGLCQECSAVARNDRRSQAALQRWYQHVAL